MHPDHLNAGVGRRLLPALIDACAAAGYRQMIAYIDVANMPSQRLHEGFGFEWAGLLRSVGFKYGRWTDSILMQRTLGPGDTAPPDDDQRPPRPTTSIPSPDQLQARGGPWPSHPGQSASIRYSCTT